jgi:acetyl esterase/lipase
MGSMLWLNGILAAFSLLAVFPAPARPLWYVAIAVTEWGHWLGSVCLALGWVSRMRPGRWGRAGVLAWLAVPLYLSPVLRAIPVARRLPADLTDAFGTAATRAEAFPDLKPLSVKDLFAGLGSPPVRMATYVFASHGGQPLELDLYRGPSPGGGQPGVVVIHGGSWQTGDRVELVGLNRYLATRGYVVASIDYRLAPNCLFPKQRDDVFSALAFLKSHATEFGLDPERFVLLGRSAGGQIALSATYAEKDRAIRGVIVFYAPNDLIWGYSVPANPLIMNSRKIIETYLGGEPAQRPRIYAEASPLLAVNERTPPTLMIHGDRDELVSPKHELRLSNRLKEKNRKFYWLRLPWATHGCDANFSGPCGQLSTYAIERFLAYATQN